MDEYFAMETWLTDNIPVPGEIYREFVKYLYQQNLLVKNQLPVGRHVVNLKRITCPVLNLMATQDDLVPLHRASRSTTWSPRPTAKRSNFPPATSAWPSGLARNANCGHKPSSGWRSAPTQGRPRVGVNALSARHAWRRCNDTAGYAQPGRRCSIDTYVRGGSMSTAAVPEQIIP